MGQTEIMIWYLEKYQSNPDAYWDVQDLVKGMNHTEANNARKDVKVLFYWAILQREYKNWDWTSKYRLSPGKVKMVEELAKLPKKETFC
jgi:hypothetical protein